jgi:hypothetical protein
MANNAFDFNQAPSGKVGRQFGALYGIANLLGGKKNNNQVSARDQSNLMRQKAGHAIDAQLIGHVLGETAADSAHKRKTQQNNQSHAQGLADREHAMNLINSNTPEGHTASSFSFPGGSASFKANPKDPGVGKQFNTEEPPVNLDNV